MENILRKATLDDSNFVLNIRNKSYVRNNSWNNKLIDMTEHSAFWLDNYQSYWIIQTEGNHKPIGFIRVKNNEVSIALEKKYWNGEYGRCAMDKISKIYPKLKAEVKLDNIHSLCFFIKCGFVPKGYILKKEENRNEI